jgi:N-acetylglucosaminyldiphosphoundecaprenol N-acetyl-beta-D-mannosaminyltransferase
VSTSTESRSILHMRVDAVDLVGAVDQIIAWALEQHARYVCVANVHMTMEAYDDPAFRCVVNGASLVVPDGMPLAWALRALGVPRAQRVRGPDLGAAVARAAAQHGLPIALYGGSEVVVREVAAHLAEHVPGIDVREAISPPYRALTSEEHADYAARLVASGARIVFVGLGCPKQERWMAQHVRSIPAVHVGIGAAFDFYAGRLPQAPRWLQSAGLEWVFRLAHEPRRLFLRYARHNPRFVVLFVKQWMLSLLTRQRS